MAEPFKEIFNRSFVRALAEALQNELPAFAAPEFCARIIDENWPGRELKQRMRHTTETLHAFLPQDYLQALDILLSVSRRFHGLAHIVFADFVECYGLEHFAPSVKALAILTQNSSSEFAVRPFIKKYPEKMMQQMEKWAVSENEHLRRLASEGCRPRLPWAMALQQFKKDQAPVLRILEILKDDVGEYVRKSVANNLNDISKDNPWLVLSTAKKWLGQSSRTDWIVKHGCRTLLRAGNTEALLLFGFQEPARIKVENLQVTPRVPMAGSVAFSFDLLTINKILGRLRLEYIIEFTKANGRRTPKIFKISEGDFSVKQRKITKSHSFRPITTRKYYPGKHGLKIIINGREMAAAEFFLG